MAKVLVIGETGQLARALRERAPSGLTLAWTRRDILDLAQPDAVEAFVAHMRPSAVINAAAYNAVDRAENEPGAAHAVNATGVAALARACARLDAPLVHVSTDYVFDGEKGAPYVEADAPNPVNAYGRSKRAGEIAVLDSGARAAVIRTSWVHSADGAGFVQAIARAAAGAGPVEIVADQFGRPTWAPDLADATVLIAQALLDGEARALGLFHYAGAGDASRADWGERVLARLAARGRTVAAMRRISSSAWPSVAPRPRDTRLDCPRYLALAGRGALRDWREGVEHTVDGLVDRAG